MNQASNLAGIHRWLDNYVRENTELIELRHDEPLFRQIDSFAVVEFLLASEEAFGLGSHVGGDALTSLTLKEIAAFIATHASKQP